MLRSAHSYSPRAFHRLKHTLHQVRTVNKRNETARIAATLGLLRIVEALATRDCLLVMNYHRIGNNDVEPFDSLVYSATAAELEQQLAYLKTRYRIVTLDEAVSLVTGKTRPKGPSVLITFDDGYIDNYRIAYPILKSFDVQGTFFLVSSYLKRPVIPWWDRIAYLVRNSQQDKLILRYPELIEIPLPPGRRAQAIRTVIDLYKSTATTDTDRFLEELEEACRPYMPMPEGVRLFLDVEEAREMVRGGMAVGSHTQTHQILSKLNQKQQVAELMNSRDELCASLGVPINTIAYPVGSKAAFNETTFSALKTSGYQAGFSFHGGLNYPPGFTPFNIKRVGADTGNPFARFRLQVAGAITARGRDF